MKMNNYYKILGKRLRKIREECHLSQKDIALRLELERSVISQIENGKRTVSAEEISKYSKIFDITSDSLLNLKKDTKIILENKSKENGVGEKTEERISIPQKNIEKFKEVLLYVLNKVASRPHIGQTVLYKLLYFIDFDFYEKYEEQLIGATYQKNHFGPTPMEFSKIVEKMKTKKELLVVDDQYFKYPKTKYLPLKEPNLSKLKSHEIDTIDVVLSKLAHMNANDISNHSHKDIPWLVTEEGCVIDYETVFYRTAPYSVRAYQ